LLRSSSFKNVLGQPKTVDRSKVVCIVSYYVDRINYYNDNDAQRASGVCILSTIGANSVWDLEGGLKPKLLDKAFVEVINK